MQTIAMQFHINEANAIAKVKCNLDLYVTCTILRMWGS